ncbi:MAG: hypothetical protein F2667_07750 [Actinobacteria bacterium]|nr:hypothetical protein [Actinomycetota bacterium]
MPAEAEPIAGEVNPWDTVVEHLQELRRAAGSPSYVTIAERIAARRVEAGWSPHAARVAKSTVYDALRPGRARVNVDFLHEIAEVLGGTGDQVDAWVAASRTSTVAPAPPVAGPSLRQAVILALACLALNLAGRAFVDFFSLPLYLDMVGTAIAAIALGPWRGALVGGATNLLGALGSGLISVPFGLVNIGGALLWGYGVRRAGMARTLPRFFALNLVVAVVCSMIAVPIIVLSLRRDLRVGDDVVTQLIGDTVDTFLLAVGFSNLLTSTGDKVISGFVALVVVTALPAAFRAGVRWVRIP